MVHNSAQCGLRNGVGAGYRDPPRRQSTHDVDSVEAVPVTGTSSNGTRELRAKFEQDPIVRAMLERFGGQISDVKRRGEE